jgi:adenylate cyclase
MDYHKKAISDASRFEYEYEIPVNDAIEMLEMCPVIIEKTRQYFAEDDVENYWVIDTFHLPSGENLIVTETELTSEDQEIDLPEWVTEEVTNNPAFYNSNIAKMIQVS